MKFLQTNPSVTLPTIQRGEQTGSALIMALIMVVVVMLIGVAAIVASNTQLRAAGNLQFQVAALNRAESTTATAEVWLNDKPGGNPNFLNAAFSGALSVPGLYAAGATLPDPLSGSWDNTNSIAVNGDDAQRYRIQLLQGGTVPGSGVVLPGANSDEGGGRSVGCNKANIYRIVTRGLGPRGAVKAVESIFAAKNC